MKNYLLIVALGYMLSIDGQVKIGHNDLVHGRAVLEIENIDNMGIIIPSVQKTENLPNYSTLQNDNYVNNPTDAGMIIYNKEIKKIMKYDGYNWILGTDKSILAYDKLSIFSSDSDNQTVVNVLNITGRPVIEFNKTNEIDNNTINNLNLNIQNGIVTINESGWYKINPSVKIKSAGGLSVGNNAVIFSLQAKYTENGDWQKIDEKSFLLGGLVVTAGSSNSVGSFTVIKYLKSGTKIRLKGGIQADSGVNLGSGVTFILNDRDTFLYIEKID